jgi:polysaccharide export outer membrane protein
MVRKFGSAGAVLTGALLVFFSLSPSVRAQVPIPTPQQLQVFEQLSPAQQQALIKAYEAGQSDTGSVSTTTSRVPASTLGPDQGQSTPVTSPLVIPPVHAGPAPLSPLEQDALKSFLFNGASEVKPAKLQPKTADGELASPVVVPAGAVINSMGLPLRQFGYDLFAGTPTTFAPATDIPVPSDYVVGPGDTIVIQLFGKMNVEHDLLVSRDGTIQFPSIGPISVAGQTFHHMQRMLKHRVEHQLIGVRASITMGALRSIRVFVLGDVAHPGSYTVSGLSTLTNALFVSGGISKSGSLRNIQLKRHGRIVDRLDLYDLLLHGDTRHDARLLPGDVIFIPPIGRTVGIDGAVSRPGIYELKKERTVEDLIQLAGGLLPNAFPQGVQISRIQSGSERSIVDEDLDKKSDRESVVQNGDVMRVYPLLDKIDKAVRLSGHVYRPGSYQWHQGMRLTDLIPSMAVLEPDVDPQYVLIRREDTKDRAIEAVSANLGAALRNPNGPANIQLMPRDQVHVFSIQDNRRSVVNPLLQQMQAQTSNTDMRKEVAVFGNVHHVGQYPLTAGMTVSDLLAAAGGPTDEAYTLKAELSRYTVEDGKERVQNHLELNMAGVLAHNAKDDIKLKPYDRLVVQRIPKWTQGGEIDLEGEFRFPGKMPVRRGETLSEIIKRAGGLTAQAYPEGAVFLRVSVRKQERKYMHKLADQLQSDLALAAAKVGEAGGDKKAALAEGKSLLAQLRHTRATGRMVIDLKSVIEDKGGKYDFTVQPGDKLIVPQRPDSVTVLGQVYYPTAHLYRSSDPMSYVKLSGGVTEVGNKRGVYVIHANGGVERAYRWFWHAHVDPGATIVVPIKVDRISSLRLATDLTRVFYQISISLASLRTIGVI